MKKISLIILISLIVVCCKKKKSSTSDPDATTTATTGAQPQMQISVKIDGVEKHCNSCYSGVYSGGLRDSYFNLTGSSEQVHLGWDGVPKPGIYKIVKYGEPFVAYGKGNFSYAASSGTLNIASVDTSSRGVVNKISATFSFKTDTVSGNFFSLTEGSINLK